MAGKISNLSTLIKSRVRAIYRHIIQDIRKRPLVNFYFALAVLVLIIVLSNLLFKPRIDIPRKTSVKETLLYSIGKAPVITVQAEIKKTGVVTVVSLAGGVAQKINFKEGDKVVKGNTLVSLSTNYQGGNAFSLQRALAGNQYKSAVETYDLQKDVIKNQREIAEKSADNADKVRDLTSASRDRTRELININKSFLEYLDNQLKNLQNVVNPTPAGGVDPESALGALQAQRAQLLAGLAQAEGSLSSMDYQADADKPPAELARLQKDLALKQLDLQEKMLAVNKEAAKLQLSLAQVTEALMFPSAPLSGVVQKVFVKEGEVVQPGTKLMVIAQDMKDDPVTAIAYVPQDIAEKISRVEESTLKIGGKEHKEFPYFISSEAVQGNLYAVYYAVPDIYADLLTDTGYIEIEIPIGYADTTEAAIFIPVDAVYQTQDAAYVFVDDKGTARSRRIELEDVYGEYVSVNKGLKDGDRVVLTRNVVEGDALKIIK